MKRRAGLNLFLLSFLQVVPQTATDWLKCFCIYRLKWSKTKLLKCIFWHSRQTHIFEGGNCSKVKMWNKIIFIYCINSGGTVAHMVGSTTLGRSGKSWAISPSKPSRFLLNGTGWWPYNVTIQTIFHYRKTYTVPFRMNLQRLSRKATEPWLNHSVFAHQWICQNQMKYSWNNLMKSN